MVVDKLNVLNLITLLIIFKLPYISLQMRDTLRSFRFDFKNRKEYICRI